jgi:hypothetical protein
VAQYVTERFATKLLGECEIVAVLRRLDRLTQDEAEMTVVPFLGVVHGLVGNMKTVMEGAQCLHDCPYIFTRVGFIRWHDIIGYNSTRLGYVSRVE